MKAWIDGSLDLNIRILKEDLPELLEGKTISPSLQTSDGRKITLSLRVGRIKRAMELEELPKNAERSQVRSYDIILDREKFEKHVSEVERNPTTEDAPFWARGIQYHVRLDRIQIHYVPV